MALVTGGARGIGRATAESLLVAGHSVALLDNDEASVALAAEELSRYGAVHAVVVDVADPAALAAAVTEVEGALGEVSILINNAGISPKHNGRSLGVGELDLAEWHAVVATNLTASFWLCHLLCPKMRAAGWGRVVNMSSQGGRTAVQIAGSHYAATKTGLIGLTRALARELAPHGVTVNAIAPGRIDTPMAKTIDADRNAAFLETIPAGRFGTPQEVGGLVSYLVSPEAGYITGATLDINGGSFMG